MEDVAPKSSPPRHAVPPVPQEQDAGQGHRSRGSSRASRWGPQDQPPEEDSSRRATSSSVDVPPAPMKVISEQEPGRPHKIEAERPESEDRLEAVTPQRDDDSEHEKKVAKDASNDRKWTDYLTRPDGDQPKGSPLRSEIRKTRDSDNRRSRDSPSRLEDSRTRDASPRVSKQQKVPEPDHGNKAPTVDEFGRFVRPGGSESDAEDSQYGSRRRRSASGSKSRSRSPVNNRRRRRSRSRSPRRHNRWSRSRRFVKC